MKYIDPDGNEILQVQEKYLMTDYDNSQKLGDSSAQANLKGCFTASMANSEYSFRKYKGNEDIFLKIANNKANFDGSDMKFRDYGMALFKSSDMGIIKGNSSALKKLEDLKKSDKTYAVFGLFKTDYGDHMVPLNDVAKNGSFNDSKVRSSKNDTNYDNRFDEKNLVEIRFFEVKED